MKKDDREWKNENTPELVLPGDEKMIGIDERDGVI